MTSVTLGRNAKGSKELQTALQDDSRRQANALNSSVVTIAITLRALSNM